MANMFPVVNTDIRMPKSMMEALSLFETQCVMLKIEEVNLEDVLDFLTKNYDKNFANKFKIEYLYPINQLDSSINKLDKQPITDELISSSSLQESLIRADVLLEKLKTKGYLVEKLPKLEEGDSLYMALHNKKRTGKFTLD
jgi:hypothetical protein